MTNVRYPEIEALQAAVDRGDLVLSLAPASDREEAGARRRIGIAPSGRAPLTISVDDEYDDSSAEDPLMLLQLVLTECETWEESEDFREWASAAGLDPASPETVALFDELSAVVPEIRSAVGHVRAISSWDVQMNSGAARALRDSSRARADGDRTS